MTSLERGLHKARYEFKYVCDPDQVRVFKEKLADVMEPDPHAAGGTYRVNSIYYDTDDYRAYFEKLDGLDRRFKLRLRVYGQIERQEDWTEFPAFLEAKHRINNRVHKDRVRIPGEEVPGMCRVASLLGLPPLTEDSPQVAELERLIQEAPVFPQCWLSYTREPLVSRLDPTLRVTFDTDLRVHGPGAPERKGIDAGTLFLPRHLCIVEVKFHWAMPIWMIDLCCSSGLRLRRYSKYCSAIETLHPWLARREVLGISPLESQ